MTPGISTMGSTVICAPNTQGFVLAPEFYEQVPAFDFFSALDPCREIPEEAHGLQIIRPIQAGNGQSRTRKGVLTVYPTTDCNLRCIYCYASSGSVKQELDLNTFQLLLADVVNPRFFSELHLHLHGGGEPTLNPTLFTTLIREFDQKCRACMIKPCYTLTTNGTFTTRIKKTIHDFGISTTVSWDGPGDIQDQQRPFATGKNSHPTVLKNIRFLREAGLLKEVRVTITPYNIGRISEIIHFLHQEGVPAVHIEPVSILGRQEDSSGICIQDFAREFKHAYVLSCQLGMPLSGRGTMLFKKPTQRHCGAFGWNFVLTSTGEISACTRIQSPTDPHASSFVLGPWIPGGDPMTFSSQKRKKLRNRTTDNLAECADCFLRYHCAGGCPMLMPEAYDDDLVRSSDLPCTLTRACTLGVLEAVREGSLPPGWEMVERH